MEWARAESVGRAVRRCWWVAVLVAMFTLVSVEVWSGGWVTRGDSGTLDWFVAHRSEWWSTAAREFTFFGNPGRATVIAMVAAGYMAWRERSWHSAALILGTVAGATLIGSVLKKVVDRQRPPMELRMVSPANMSYPSGHATATAALVGVLLLVYLSSRPSRVRGWFAVSVGVAVVVLMCATRLYLGVHWLSDVVGGTLLGCSAVAIAAVVQVVWAQRSAKVLESAPRTNQTDGMNLR